ncbi:MAG: hypothetical protein WBM08_03695 [Prochlorococcaceae cyanobacterium]
MTFILDPQKIKEARTDYWTPGRGTVDPSATQNQDGSFTYTLDRGDGKDFKQTSNLPDPFQRDNRGRLYFNDIIAGQNKFYNPNQKFVPDEYFNQTARENFDYTSGKLKDAQDDGNSLIENILAKFTANLGGSSND